MAMPLITWAQDPNFFIFLCFGQSNMEGQGTIAAEDRTVDSRFQLLQSVDCPNLNRTKGNWYTAVPPLTRCWTRLSPADYFGRTLVENLPEHVRIGVINVSVGGCRIELFDKDQYQNHLNTFPDDWFQDILDEYNRNPYAHLVNLAKKAQQEGVIKGILLHQGESNNSDQQWPTKVKKIYTDLITDLDLDAAEVPLLAGELVHADQGGLLAGMNTIINKLPETLPNSFVISSSGCSDQTDNIHFDAAGYRELGRRYGQKMLELLEDDVTEPLAIRTHTSYHLHNFPNPASGHTTFRFTLPQPAEVSLKIYDLLGQEVCTVLNDYLPAGPHEVAYPLAGLRQGIYLYTLRTGTLQVTRRLVVE